MASREPPYPLGRQRRAPAPPQVSFAGDGRGKRQKVETSGNLLSSETSGGQHGFTVYADGPHRYADRLPRLQIVQRCGDGRNDILLSAGELVLGRKAAVPVPGVETVTEDPRVSRHATAVTNGYLFFYVSDGLGL